MDRSYVAEWGASWGPWEKDAAVNGTKSPPLDVHNKVLKWAEEHCQRRPYFIKVVSRYASQRTGFARWKPVTRVPAAFVRDHYRELQREVILEDARDGCTWKVAFNAPVLYPFWVQGWPKFARDNKLQVGNIMVFVLVANSHLQVTHFDKNGYFRSRNRSRPATWQGATMKRLPVKHEQMEKCICCVHSDGDDSSVLWMQQGSVNEEGNNHGQQATRPVLNVKPISKPFSRIERLPSDITGRLRKVMRREEAECKSEEVAICSEAEQEEGSISSSVGRSTFSGEDSKIKTDANAYQTKRACTIKPRHIPKRDNNRREVESQSEGSTWFCSMDTKEQGTPALYRRRSVFGEPTARAAVKGHPEGKRKPQKVTENIYRGRVYKRGEASRCTRAYH